VSSLNTVLPARVEAALYRVAQEALANALKHSNALEIEIGLRGMEQFVCLFVRDNGQGFDPSHIQSGPGHFGLTGMSERVKLLNGSMSIHSELATGTSIAVTVPY
jgi:signal transduction histidine kinase